MTKVMPMPRIAINATCFTRITMLPVVKNAGAVKAKITIKMNRAISVRRRSTIIRGSRRRSFFAGCTCGIERLTRLIG